MIVVPRLQRKAERRQFAVKRGQANAMAMYNLILSKAIISDQRLTHELGESPMAHYSAYLNRSSQSLGLKPCARYTRMNATIVHSMPPSRLVASLFARKSLLLPGATDLMALPLLCR